MAVKTENSLQKHLLECLRKEGFSGFHLSPINSPGFPDLLIVKNCLSFYIEIKDFNKIGDGEKMFNILTQAQPTFYLSFVKNDNQILIFGIYGTETILFTIDTSQKVKDMLNLKKKEYVKKYGDVVTSDELIEILKEACK